MLIRRGIQKIYHSLEVGMLNCLASKAYEGQVVKVRLNKVSKEAMNTDAV